MKNAVRWLGFDDRWLLVLGVPFVALVLSSVMYGQLLVESPRIFFTVCGPISVFYTATFWLLFRAIIITLRKKTQLQTKTFHRIFLEIICILAAYLLVKPVLTILVNTVGGESADLVKPHPSLEVFSSLIFSYLILFIYETAYIQKQLEKSNLEKEKLGRAHMQAQLEGLKNQIQPHFLFNSLNTLTALIHQDSTRAERYVQKLCKVLRYVLDMREEVLIPLEREIQFLKAYMFLLKERFGDNLQLNLHIEKKYYSEMVAPLTLQILFENAIKHNTISGEKPLRVDIHVTPDHKLVVSNTLQPKKTEMNSTKTGLANIRRRYQFLMDDPIEIRKTWDSFVVTLPLLSQVQDRSLSQS